MITPEVHAVLAAVARRDTQQAAVAAEARRDLEAKIRWASEGGATYAEISRAIGLTPGRISQILSKKPAAAA